MIKQNPNIITPIQTIIPDVFKIRLASMKETAFIANELPFPFHLPNIIIEFLHRYKCQ